MGRRVLETLCPVGDTNKKSNRFWTWIMLGLGLRSNADTRSEEFDLQSLMFPWHLIKSIDDRLFIINRRHGKFLWIQLNVDIPVFCQIKFPLSYSRKYSTPCF
ncbi:unnamed protein product [Prunus brigantina]